MIGDEGDNFRCRRLSRTPTISDGSTGPDFPSKCYRFRPSRYRSNAVLPRTLAEGTSYQTKKKTVRRVRSATPENRCFSFFLIILLFGDSAVVARLDRPEKGFGQPFGFFKRHQANDPLLSVGTYEIFVRQLAATLPYYS